jgi:hypothetical protein
MAPLTCTLTEGLLLAQALLVGDTDDLQAADSIDHWHDVLCQYGELLAWLETWLPGTWVQAHAQRSCARIHHYTFRRAAKAVPLYVKALMIFESVAAEVEPEYDSITVVYARLLHDLANALGDLVATPEDLATALDTAATALPDLSAACELAGGWPKIGLLERALAIKQRAAKRTSGADTIGLADTLRSLGNAYADKAARTADAAAEARALALLRECLALVERQLPVDALQRSFALRALGGACRVDTADQAAERKQHLEAALAIIADKRGPRHIEVATTLIKLAPAHVALGEIEATREGLARAVSIYTERVGEKHADTVNAARMLEDLPETGPAAPSQ